MVEKETVRRGYDGLASVHADQRSDDGRGTEILAEFVDSLSDSARVLDAGCGQGTPVLSRLSAETSAVGVDFSRQQLRLAADNAPGASLVHGDMTRLPFGSDTFDAVVAYWSLIHVPMDDHQAVIDEFSRVVRPGGRVLLCEGTTEWVGENPNWLDSGIEMQWEIAGANATQEQLCSAGFAVVDSWGTPSELEADREEESDGDEPWTFFAARLDA